MMIKKTLRNTQGFGLILPLFIVVVVGVVGSVSWYVVKSKPKAAVIQTEHTHSHTNSSEVTPTSVPTEDAAYTTISEFGVKFPASKTIPNLRYSYKTNGSVIFNSDTCPEGSGTLGSLSRRQTDDNTHATQSDDGFVAHVGSFYYYYAHPTDLCSSNAGIEAQAEAEHGELIKAFEALTVR